MNSATTTARRRLDPQTNSSVQAVAARMKEKDATEGKLCVGIDFGSVPFSF